MAKYGEKASSKVGNALHEQKAGKLKGGTSGKTVTSRKQAIAIGLSEARKEGDKVPSPPKKTAAKKATAKKAATKKASARKAASKKAPAKKAVAKKAPAKKTATRKAPAKKVAKKVAAKKAS